jgi:hypothetical protein
VLTYYISYILRTGRGRDRLSFRRYTNRGKSFVILNTQDTHQRFQDIRGIEESELKGKVM